MRPVKILVPGLIALLSSACDVPQGVQEEPEQSVQEARTRPEIDRASAEAGDDAAELQIFLDSNNAGLAELPEDPWLWLEDITGTRALMWVLKHNRETQDVLQGDPRFDSLKGEALAIMSAGDRIPYGGYRNGFVYNFWQDEEHPRGMWRRTKLESYRTGEPEWDVLLDVDKLAAEEGVNWVLSGVSCLPPAYERCMVALSRGGRDRTTLREWDAVTRSFVENGFRIEDSYSSVTWLDRDTLLVGSGQGQSRLAMVLFGPRANIRKWKRGTPLAVSEIIYEGKKTDLGVFTGVVHRPEGSLTLFVRKLNFYDSVYAVLKEDGSVAQLPVPLHAELGAIFKEQLLFTLRKPWTLKREDGEQQPIPQGALFSFDLDAFLKTGELPEIRTVYVPDERSSVAQLATTRDTLLLGLLNNIQSELWILRYENGEWRRSPVVLPESGNVTVSSANDFNNVVFFAFENYLTPDSLFELDVETGEVKLMKSQPARFDAGNLTVERFEATSPDGTKVPWTLVRPQGAKRDGSLPVLLYGYGGFGISLTPTYWAEIGKLWLEKGGAFAVANIRGGGEFGPRWQEAGRKLNRPRSYEDFIAVAEDMIARKITSPRRLGIMGGSNGGLLVGVAFTKRPDLYNAVVCVVPLLDMMRFTKLPPGHIWISEYGNPSVAEDQKVLLSYSPYHNVKKDADYPKVFFLTSTDDDRVHAGHARKMAARMEEMGHDVFYYEYFEGGHSSRAHLPQRADILALQFVYLARRLMDEKEPGRSKPAADGTGGGE